MAELLIPKSLADILPAVVRSSLSELSAARQDEFLEEYYRRAKSESAAYLLWLLGFHYIYVRKWGLQFLYWLTLYGLLVWWLVDAFRVPALIKNYNRDVAIDVMRILKTIRSD